MANEVNATDKSPAELAERVWELAEKIKFAMFTTWDGEKQRSRPLAAMPDRQAHAIHFLVDQGGGKNDEIARFPAVSLAFAETRSHDYVVISGTAELSNDRSKIGELWSAFDKAWWDSAEDPAIRLLTVTPEEAELWEGPNKLVAGAIMLTSAVTGAKPPLGEHGHVRM